MISHFFIDRPIFAMVLSIVFIFGGGVALTQLPIAQYPEITPPTVQVTATYPGANARVVANSVAAPIEQMVNGVENMLWMDSQSTNDGTYTLTVTFAVGTDIDMAQVLVQNRVQRATAQLPPEVQQQGVVVKKKSPSILLVINVYSPDESIDPLEISNFVTIQMLDELSRVDGVGDVTLFGQQDYAMRVWLNPEALAYNRLQASDVVNAMREQNTQVAAGRVGSEPAPPGQAFQFTLSTLGRLQEVRDFENIVVKTGERTSDGKTRPAVRLKDVGRVVLTAKTMDQSCTLNGVPSTGAAIYQLPGSNALATAERVKAKMEELKGRFPEGLAYKIAYDTTPFIDESIHEVEKALRDAFILVAIVVLIFLQNWRSTLIPLIAVPVSIIGTFLFMAALGFSLNNLSLFGLVLAIGIVVDDAIVVVENVERWLHQGLSPRDAARKAMDEVSGPVIAISLVLCAVFVPCAFISGITGQFFQQFAVTIAVSTIISAINSLTLSPALCALLLKKRGARPDPLTKGLNLVLGWFFKGFNKGFEAASNVYASTVKGLLRVAVIVLVVYGGLLFLTYRSFVTAPIGFIPEQDKGFLIVSGQLSDAASLQRTNEVVALIGEIVRKDPAVSDTVGIAGYSFLLNAQGSNFVSIFVILKPFDERRHERMLSGRATTMRLQMALYRKVQDAVVGIFPPPPVEGLGSAGGFRLMIQDRGDLGPDVLQTQINNLLEAGREAPEIAGAATLYRSAIPQLYVDIDRQKCKQLGVPLGDVFATLQVYLGGAYVNDFNLFGRTWQVWAQADAKFRATAEYIRQLRVRNDRGQMVPLGAVATIEDSYGPVTVERYNMYSAAAINGNLNPATSTGQGMKVLEELSKQTLPRQMSSSWTEIFYMQKIAGNTAVYVFAGAVILVFLVLAAQYESWSLPLGVILVVPMCLLCAITGISLVGLDVNIFVQIGFVVLVGLAAKNAILIIEFAKQERERGVPLREATVEACRTRLRPILMTSFAFILGVVPLALATGAGAEMRRPLGIAVSTGMLGVTLFGLFLTPVFFYTIGKLTVDKKALPAQGDGNSAHEHTRQH